MTEKLTTYDSAAALVNDEEIGFFMADALESGDASYIAKALGIVARAKGMTQIANQTGLSEINSIVRSAKVATRHLKRHWRS